MYSTATGEARNNGLQNSKVGSLGIRNTVQTYRIANREEALAINNASLDILLRHLDRLLRHLGRRLLRRHLHLRRKLLELMLRLARHLLLRLLRHLRHGHLRSHVLISHGLRSGALRHHGLRWLRGDLGDLLSLLLVFGVLLRAGHCMLQKAVGMSDCCVLKCWAPEF